MHLYQKQYQRCNQKIFPFSNMRNNQCVIDNNKERWRSWVTKIHQLLYITLHEGNSELKLEFAGNSPMVLSSSNVNGLKKNGDELVGLSCFTIINASLGFWGLKIEECCNSPAISSIFSCCFGCSIFPLCTAESPSCWH